MNLIKKIVFALVIGILFMGLIIQNHDDFKNLVETKIKSMAKELLACDIECSIKNINLFYPAVELENVTVNDKSDENWLWQCKNLKVQCSWSDFLFSKKFKANIEIYKYNASSAIVNGNLAILPHIKKIIFEDKSGIPITIKNLKLNKSELNIYDKEIDALVKLSFKCELKKIDSNSKIALYLTNGMITAKDKSLCDEISGSVKINISQNSKFTIDMSGYCNLPPLNDQNNKCYYFGKWNDARRFLQISTIDGKLNIGPLNIYQKNKKLNLDILILAPIKYIQKLLNVRLDTILEGDCVLDLTTDINNENLSGHCSVKNFSCPDLLFGAIKEVKINFSKKNEAWSGKLIVDKDEDSLLKASLNLNRRKDKTLDGNYICNIFNHRFKDNIDTQGQFSFSSNCLLKVNGELDNEKYKLECIIAKDPILKKFVYYSDNKTENVKIVSNQFNEITATISFDFLKKLFNRAILHNLSDSGELILQGQFINNKFSGKLKSNNFNIIIPNTYNIFKKVESEIELDFIKKKVFFNNGVITLHKGRFKCNNGVIIFEDWFNFKPKFLHFPIAINSFFIKIKRDVLALISGKILLQQYIDRSDLNIDGYLAVDSGQIKNNIMSTDFQNEILLNLTKSNNKTTNAKMNLALWSKSPIKVKTPLLSTKIKFDLNILNNISKPEVSGSIELIGGKISFPYKDFNIINGNIYFLPHQTFDPILNLTAKGKIKRYNITVYVIGSIRDQTIKFESSPPLSDEQIMALLLLGTEKSSMNILVPALIMQNIKNIILGSSTIHAKTKQYLDTLLKPFKYISFVPTFNNETGRGGLSGTVEININDRFIASIQKGFTFAEDTRFEVGYSITDEINLKAVKDERGDLAGEIEMRWKF